MVGVVIVSSLAALLGRLRPRLAPARSGAADAVLVGRSVDGTWRRHPILVGRSKVERVEARRSPARSLTRPGFDGIRRRVQQLAQALALVGLEGREDVIPKVASR